MSKPDAWQQTAAERLNRRHVDKARELAESVREYAGYIIRSLDVGEIPNYSLVSDATELARRLAAIEALRDLTEIYETTGEG